MAVFFIPFPLPFVDIAIAVVIRSFTMPIAKKLVSVVWVYSYIISVFCRSA